MADTIEIKIEENEPPKIRCVTCDNDMSESRAFRFPICNDCLKVLREIIKERRLEKEKEKK